MTQERTMLDLYARSLARTSFTLVMLAIVGAWLCCSASSGSTASSLAQPRQLEKQFVLHGLSLSVLGVVVGLIGAVALARAMSSLLFGIEPLDPIAYVTAIGVILVAAAFATYVPARRAAKIDPIETLKAE